MAPTRFSVHVRSWLKTEFKLVLELRAKPQSVPQEFAVRACHAEPASTVWRILVLVLLMSVAQMHEAYPDGWQMASMAGPPPKRCNGSEFSLINLVPELFVSGTRDGTLQRACRGGGDRVRPPSFLFRRGPCTCWKVAGDPQNRGCPD